MVNMYPFLPRCVDYDRDCGGIIILQKMCMNQVLLEEYILGGFLGRTV